MLKLSGYNFSESTAECMFAMADLDGDGLIQPHEVFDVIDSQSRSTNHLIHRRYRTCEQ